MSGTLLPAGTTPGAPDDSPETSSCGQWAECLGLLTSCWGRWADWTCTEVTAFWIILGLEGCQAFLSCRVLEYVFSFNKKSFFKKNLILGYGCLRDVPEPLKYKVVERLWEMLNLFWAIWVETTQSLASWNYLTFNSMGSSLFELWWNASHLL